MTKWRNDVFENGYSGQRNSIYKYIYIYYFFDPNTRFQKRHFVISSLRHFQDYRIVMNTIKKNIITCSLHVLYKHRKVKNRPRASYSPFTFINNTRHSFAFPPPRHSTTTCDKNGLFDYATLSFDGAIAHLAHFCANLWQIFTLIWHIHHIPLSLSGIADKGKTVSFDKIGCSPQQKKANELLLFFSKICFTFDFLILSPPSSVWV